MSQRKNPLPIAERSLRAAAAKWGTPLHLLSGDLIRNRATSFRDAVRSELRGVETQFCFAVKANPSLAVLKILKSIGYGFDSVSGGEISRALKAGASPSQIVFSGVGKSDEEITFALSSGGGIGSFNVESESELNSIIRIADQKKKHAKIAFRYNPDIDAGSHPYISTGRERDKFGLDQKTLLKLVEIARKSRNVSMSGLSVHIGSQLLNLRPLDRAFGKLTKLARKVEGKLGRRLDFLDLGGGLGVRYQNETPPVFRDYARMVAKHFSGEPYRLIFEPGRALVAEAGVIVARVLRVKKTSNGRFIVIDAGMSELIRPALYGSWHEIHVLGKSGSGKTADVVGPHCESSDFIGLNRKIPTTVREGDLVVIATTGAYGTSMSSRYNSRPLAAEVLINGNTLRLIRKRESFGDLIRHEIP